MRWKQKSASRWSTYTSVSAGFEPIAEAIKDGRILGIVNMVGCNNPKVLYEKCIVDVADVLLKNNVLIISNGCASFPLMKLGYCAVSGKEKAGRVSESSLNPIFRLFGM